ncbi:hypothetical protein H6A24_08885 [Bacteroides caecicola]|uniref:DUF4376 domain-containing protein n=1 Tax=Bacteroides caecicola TaxID=1462569 RepID=A0ABS2F9A0_9BACE|nr:hypothetical protein [Bacteroides caecicola]MBM6806608.1 hypothetical protein [Bacteroides caecicola]
MKGKKYNVGDEYCYEMDFELCFSVSAKGIVVYNNGTVAVARVWYGDLELLTAMEEGSCTYTEEEIARMFSDFKDEHERRVQEWYLLIDLETDALINKYLEIGDTSMDEFE